MRLSNGKQRNVLMVSWDYCRTWKVFTLPDGYFTTEQWVGHNEIDGPPFLAFWRPFAGPYAGHRGHRYALWVTQPRLDGQNLVVPTPTLVTTACLGLSKDSGGSSFAVTHGDSTWFVWPGSSAKQAPGVPQYVACYDHLTGSVSTPQLLAVTPPCNDPHSKPGICIDSQGILHVVCGTHGTAMPYTHSLVPYSCDDGWSAPVPVLSDGFVNSGPTPTQSGRQTYSAFVCDSHDTLHLITRQWRRGVDAYFPGLQYGALVAPELPRRRHLERADGDRGAGGPRIRHLLPEAGPRSQRPPLPFMQLRRRRRSLGAARLECSHGRSRPRRDHARHVPAPHAARVSDDGGATWRFAQDSDLSPTPTPTPTPSASSAPRRSPTAAAPPAVSWFNPLPQGNQLTAIDMVSNASGWAVGTHGTILETQNAGATWLNQTSRTTANLFAVAAVNRRYAWAVGMDGLILRTSNGGLTWQQQTVRHHRLPVRSVRDIGAPGVGSGDSWPGLQNRQRRAYLEPLHHGYRR